MIKYLNTKVVFQEIPDEISLAINITNCPFLCFNCHSPELRLDIGEELTKEKLDIIIEENPGITCVLFMGGDRCYKEIEELAFYIHSRCNPPYKVGWYSGNIMIPTDLQIGAFDYIKIGPYIAERGPINNKNTNQILYKVNHKYNTLENITYKFIKTEIL